MNEKDLTALLHKRADAQLEIEAKDAMSAVYALLSRADISYDIGSLPDGEPFRYATKSGSLMPLNNFQAVSSLHRQYIEALRERRRAEAVKEFLDKVDSLQDQMDELRNSVGQ